MDLLQVPMVHQHESSMRVLPPKELSDPAGTATEVNYLENIVGDYVEPVVSLFLYARIRVETTDHSEHLASIVHQAS